MPMTTLRARARTTIRRAPQAGVAALLAATMVRPPAAAAAEPAAAPKPVTGPPLAASLLSGLLHPDALLALAMPTPPRGPAVLADLTSAQWAQAEAIVDLLKVPYGSRVDDGDLAEAAHRVGLAVGQSLDVDDVRGLLGNFDNRAGAPLRRLGYGYGAVLDASDVVAAAHELGLKVGREVDLSDVDNVGAEATARADARDERRSRTDTRTPFATVRGVTLFPPSRHVRLVGFHQASYRVAEEMNPTARHGMRTLASRRRGTPRQSAADVAVVPGTTVFAPVTGRVVEVHPYRLYGKYPDTKIRIVPDSNPSQLVTMLHVTGAKVRVGQHVEATRTPIAAHATFFPFWSQIENTTGRSPHVHVEVRHR